MKELRPFCQSPNAQALRSFLSHHLHPLKVDEIMNLTGNWVSALFTAHCFGLLDPTKNARIDRVGADGFRITYGPLRVLRKIAPAMPVVRARRDLAAA
jgi:hypothetical protein